MVLLHDRGVLGSRANIDHIAIAPTGVWVIDSKRYQGKVAVSNPLFGQAMLTINGRDKSKLIDGLGKQVALVKAVIAERAPDVPVHGALCFVDSDLPTFGKLTFKGFPLLYRNGWRSASTPRGRSPLSRCALSPPSSRCGSPSPEQGGETAGVADPVSWARRARGKQRQQDQQRPPDVAP